MVEIDRAEIPSVDRTASRSSPRPTFSQPTYIPYASVTQHLWGDETSGEVADWIYVSSDKVHQLVFGLPPGGAFRHSEHYRTVFAADELLYVLSGVLVLANPESGEVQRLEPGQAVFFRRDTWHHGFSFGPEALRVLEFFAPPPATGASSQYARTKENLRENSYLDLRWLNRWPISSEERARALTMRPITPQDILWSLDGPSGTALAGIYVSTEHLTAGELQLRPGGKTDLHSHGGDETIYVLDGPLSVYLPDADGPDGQRWFEVNYRDGFYLPAGTRHEFRNVGSSPARLLFAVAPSLLPIRRA
ncbi:MAG: cupin domain-containing protein [Acidimicrobiales bacterium]